MISLRSLSTIALSLPLRFQIEIWSPLFLTETIIPHISFSSVNYSPMKARIKSSQSLFANPFYTLSVHLPPFLLALSSHIGLIPSTNLNKVMHLFDLPFGDLNRLRVDRVSWETGKSTKILQPKKLIDNVIYSWEFSNSFDFIFPISVWCFFWTPPLVASINPEYKFVLE